MAVDPSFYDEAYYRDGSKSNYAPYGPGSWADWIVEMVAEHLDDAPASVLDVGCAYGYLVQRFWGKGINAWGFDISRYAIEQQGYYRTWVGDCTDPEAWRMEVDLTIATELGEHLTPEQAGTFLELAAAHSRRMLMLIAVDPGDYDHRDEKDGSHIHVVPMTWWEEAVRAAGWVVSDASLFNADWRSKQMGWQGRWLYLQKED